MRINDMAILTSRLMNASDIWVIASWFIAHKARLGRLQSWLQYPIRDSIPQLILGIDGPAGLPSTRAIGG
jgi:hypothetical protein